MRENIDGITIIPIAEVLLLHHRDINYQEVGRLIIENFEFHGSIIPRKEAHTS